jgi:hypothetical protein
MVPIKETQIPCVFNASSAAIRGLWLRVVDCIGHADAKRNRPRLRSGKQQCSPPAKDVKPAAIIKCCKFIILPPPPLTIVNTCR